MYNVKFDLYREPTSLKQIAKWPLGFGVILILLTVFIHYPGRFLPLELYIFYAIEIAGEFTLHLIALGAICISIGYVLDYLGWCTGQLIIESDRLLIKGNKEFYLKYESITRVKYLNRNTIQVRTRYYPVRIKFINRENLQEVCSILEKQTGYMLPVNLV